MVSLAVCVIMATAAFSGCVHEVSSGVGISDNVDPAMYDLYDCYIDDYGNRGIVADLRLDDTSSVNYIIALSLDEGVAEWGPEDEAVFPLFDGFNVGYINGFYFGLDMNQIVSSYGRGRFPVFDWCHSKNSGEPIHSSSWILPTMSEYESIFGNDISRLNKAMVEAGGSPIAVTEDLDALYWTAVEDIDGYFHFSDESISAEYDQKRRAVPILYPGLFPVDKTLWEKHNSYRVRAIKYIYFRSDPDSD